MASFLGVARLLGGYNMALATVVRVEIVALALFAAGVRCISLLAR